MPTERLQKILARGGYASRRAAEKLVTEGHVRVNGRVVTELGSKADPRKDRVEVNGERVVAEQLVYIVLHKPRGVVTTMNDPEGRPSIREILAPIGARVYPVGRLDFATSGVLLATNDGEFADGLMHPKRAVPKTYVLKVRNKMESKDLDRWREGIRLEDGVTLPAKASLLRHEGDKTWVELTIREGRNQQIRRMGDATGFPVMRLARVSFAGISSEGLRPGEWRHLTREELRDLKQEYGVPKKLVDVDAREVADSMKGRSHRHVQKGPPARPGTARGRDARPARPTEQAGGPRYGGGAPGRRGYDVKEDWGGGARRGRSDRVPETGGRGESPRRGSSGGSRGSSDGASWAPPRRGQHEQDAPRGDLGGRGGHSRTTGTGGGIGASGGSYRGKSRGR
jgi:23S rRNA pseudouridine2605 synthase